MLGSLSRVCDQRLDDDIDILTKYLKTKVLHDTRPQARVVSAKTGFAVNTSSMKGVLAMWDRPA
jgi:hypothetical protein